MELGSFPNHSLWGEDMLNKKGSSLVELVISIALMSIVLVFMLKLLVDLNNTATNNTYASKNEVIRSEIIRMINNDINENTLTGISSTSNNNLIITFSFNGGKTGVIEATNNTIEYTSSKNNKRKWTLNEGEIYTNCVHITKIKEDPIYILEINLEIHTSNELNNKTNNNILDDIIISKVGASSEFDINSISDIGVCN